MLPFYSLNRSYFKWKRFNAVKFIEILYADLVKAASCIYFETVRATIDKWPTIENMCEKERWIF